MKFLLFSCTFAVAFGEAAPSEDGPTQQHTPVVNRFLDKELLGRKDPTLLVDLNWVTRLAFELVRLPSLRVAYTGALVVKERKETTGAV